MKKPEPKNRINLVRFGLDWASTLTLSNRTELNWVGSVQVSNRLKLISYDISISTSIYTVQFPAPSTSFAIRSVFILLFTSVWKKRKKSLHQIVRPIFNPPSSVHVDLSSISTISTILFYNYVSWVFLKKNRIWVVGILKCPNFVQTLFVKLQLFKP